VRDLKGSPPRNGLVRNCSTKAGILRGKQGTQGSVSYDIVLWVIQSYKRACGLARGGVETIGHVAGPHHSWAAWDGARERGTALPHEARRLRQRSARPLSAPWVFTPVKGIADTGVRVASTNADDAPQLWAAQIAVSVTEPLPTCEAVLAQTAFHSKRVGAFRDDE
jgi:hypothetical protein